VKTEIITPDGTRTGYTYKSKPRDTAGRLREMCAIIGNGCTTVEHIALPGGGHLWCDEDGSFKNVDLNEEASKLYWSAGGIPTAWISGTVIVETKAMQERAL